MSDISMCHGLNCPSKNQCYRFRAKPSNYQSYAPYDEDRPKAQDRCGHFWDASEYVEKNLTPIDCPIIKEQDLIDA